MIPTPRAIGLSDIELHVGMFLSLLVGLRRKTGTVVHQYGSRQWRHELTAYALQHDDTYGMGVLSEFHLKIDPKYLTPFCSGMHAPLRWLFK